MRAAILADLALYEAHIRERELPGCPLLQAIDRASAHMAAEGVEHPVVRSAQGFTQVPPTVIAHWEVI